MYELLYIVSPSFTDPEVEEVKKKIETLITTEGGEIKEHKVLTKQALAYPIKKMKHGTYLLMHFVLEGSALSKIERILRLELGNEVLRHLVSVVTEEEAKKAFEMLPYTYPLAEKEKRASAPRPAPRQVLPPPPPACTQKVVVSNNTGVTNVAPVPTSTES